MSKNLMQFDIFDLFFPQSHDILDDDDCLDLDQGLKPRGESLHYTVLNMLNIEVLI
jgi:hypothetical protein